MIHNQELFADFAIINGIRHDNVVYLTQEKGSRRPMNLNYSSGVGYFSKVAIIKRIFSHICARKRSDSETRKLFLGKTETGYGQR